MCADLFDKYELNLSVNERLKRDCGESIELAVDIGMMLNTIPELH